MSKQFCRAWLEVKGKVVDAIAVNNSITLSETELSMTFQGNSQPAELTSIAAGSDFIVEENSIITETLETKVKNKVGKLKFSGSSDFKLHSIDSAIAWYLVGEGEKESEAKGLEIVKKSEVKFDDQIAISQDGRIFVSENVNDKLVKIRTDICIPRQVMTMPIPLPEIKAHLIYIENDAVWYSGIIGKVINSNSSLKQKKTIVMQISEKTVEAVN
ncbi:hypothetical protein Cl131_gp010 [Aphanizomenon phage vB_AphaS-CL131]|nr:hypothetical protein Cl131_gp010 [Aphanizomenon phage vB_AphaS-CL131]